MQPQLPDDLLTQLSNDGIRLANVEKSLTNDAIQVGTAIMWPGATTYLPFNYKFADGSAIDRIGYAAAFQNFGTTFGVGDGSTTFNLPNYSSFVLPNVPASPVWTALPYGTNYTNFGSGYTNGQYSKDENGIVYTEGMIKKTTAMVVGDTMFTLPANFRPAAPDRRILPTVPDGANHTFLVAEIATSGAVTIAGTGIAPTGTVNSIGCAMSFDSGVLPATNTPILIAIKVL